MIEEKDKSIIPYGDYCYIWEIEPKIAPVVFRPGKIKCCPYWSRNLDKPEQEDGYCAYLEKGDWDLGPCSLLWDQCKECGVNWDDEEMGDDDD
jgi:hypothetical protein